MNEWLKRVALIEKVEGSPILECLPRLYEEFSLEELSKRWGLSKSTLWYLILKLFYPPRRLLVPRGYEVKIILVRKVAK